MERWIINNQTLSFDEDKHAYYLNDERCVSVTQLIKFKFPHKYDGVSEQTLQAAAERGLGVHEAVEMYEKYGLCSYDLEEFNNYLWLKKQFKFECLYSEIPIVLKINVESGKLTICGRLDQVQSRSDLVGIADLKATSTLDKPYLMYQLNMYRMGFMQSYHQNIDYLSAIHLNGDKRKYIDLPINENIVTDLAEEYLRSKL